MPGEAGHSAHGKVAGTAPRVCFWWGQFADVKLGEAELGKQALGAAKYFRPVPACAPPRTVRALK